MKMQDAMCVTLSQINDDYRELVESKEELSVIFYELQEGAPFHVAGVQR